MNQIHQNERLKLAHKLGVITGAMLHAALHCPVFMYTIPQKDDWSEDEKEFIYNQVIERSTWSLLATPYRCFRVSEKDQWIQVWVDPDRQPILFVHADTKGHCLEIMWWRTGEMKHNEKGEEVSKVHYEIITDDHLAPAEEAEALRKMEDFEGCAIQGPMNDVVCLCFDLSTKRCSVIKVEPNKPGKSVEWMMSRTHYLVLHRKLAQRMASTRKVVSDHDIKRSAHWRRAHLRRLSSLKFTYKRGALVPVKEAWVGPKEWIGLDGKIYKVME